MFNLASFTLHLFCENILPAPLFAQSTVFINCNSFLYTNPILFSLSCMVKGISSNLLIRLLLSGFLPELFPTYFSLLVFYQYFVFFVPNFDVDMLI